MTRLALIAIGAALMTIATVVYVSHRRPPVAAPLYREDDEGWVFGV